MNDQVIKVAGEIVNGLKSSPALLALISLQLISIAAMIWFLQSLSKAQSARVDLILRACLPGLKP